MEKFYVTYALQEGSVESHHYDVLVEAKDIDDVESNLKQKLMKEDGTDPDDVSVYDVLSEIDYFDLKSWRELDIDSEWD